LIKTKKIYIGQKLINENSLDSVLKYEVIKIKPLIDTPSVVINADTLAFHGTVFKVMQAAKRAGARVAENVK